MRLTTESIVDVAYGHPFWAEPFPDISIVHNGQLTNYFRFRRLLTQEGYRFHTSNDSELIAVYLADRMLHGETLWDALKTSVDELDGCFAYLFATEDEMGSAKDPLAIKSLVATNVGRRDGDRDRGAGAAPGVRERARHRPARAALDLRLGPRRRRHHGDRLMAAGIDLQGATAQIDADAWPKGLNRELRRLAEEEGVTEFVIENPRSRHNLGVGQTADVTIRFRGSVGNYCGGLNSGSTIYVERNAGWAAGEAMAKGKVVVEGNANMATGASMRGGTIHIKGSAAARCGVSLKGGTLIVEGDVGYLSAFMTHAGDLIVCGSTGAAFADSLWQGNVWVAGRDPLARHRRQGRRGERRRAGARARPAARERRGRDVHVPQGRLRAEALVLQQPQPRRLAEDLMDEIAHPTPGYDQGRSHIWTAETIRAIHAKAELGRYQIRGFSTFQKLPTLDDLVFLPGVMTRLPLEGYREHCETKTWIGGGRPDLVSEPLELAFPVYLTSMSFGALGTNAKRALGMGFSRAGLATCTGEGGMLPEEREASDKLIYQMTPSRYGLDLEHLRMADAIEIVVGQGAKPGTGGMLLGMKVSEKVAAMRTLPVGVDQRSAARHPDFLGGDDLAVKIEELREATDYRVPIILKLAACRVEQDVKIAAKTGCDAIVSTAPRARRRPRRSSSSTTRACRR